MWGGPNGRESVATARRNFILFGAKSPEHGRPSKWITSALRVRRSDHLPAGAWSRRLTQEHRVVHLVRDDRVDFLQARYHY